MNLSDVLWVEKYRPKEIDDCILPEKHKKFFKSVIKSGSLPNLLLHSVEPGVGKTTISLILTKKLGYETLTINGSKESTIDILRDKIEKFASSISFDSARKCVIIDEADGLSSKFQQALRGFIEEYSSNCSFIFTCNSLDKILKPIQSRFGIISFDYQKTLVKEELWKQCLVRCLYILNQEGVEYDKKGIANLVKDYSPEFRELIGALQVKAHEGEGTIKDYSFSREDEIDALFELIKTKKLKECFEWVAKHPDINIQSIIDKFNKNIYTLMDIKSQPNIFLDLNDYQMNAMKVNNPEINLRAFLVVLMHQYNFK